MRVEIETAFAARSPSWFPLLVDEGRDAQAGGQLPRPVQAARRRSTPRRCTMPRGTADLERSGPRRWRHEPRGRGTAGCCRRPPRDRAAPTSRSVSERGRAPPRPRDPARRGRRVRSPSPVDPRGPRRLGPPGRPVAPDTAELARPPRVDATGLRSPGTDNTSTRSTYPLTEGHVKTSADAVRELLVKAGVGEPNVECIPSSGPRGYRSGYATLGGESVSARS